VKKPVVTVTDHAVLRYLERVLLMDVETLRRRIGREIDRRMIEGLPDPSGVEFDGIRFRISGRHVTTCILAKRPQPSNEKGDCDE
jgi:hypothetical protein